MQLGTLDTFVPCGITWRSCWFLCAVCLGMEVFVFSVGLNCVCMSGCLSGFYDVLFDVVGCVNVSPVVAIRGWVLLETPEI